MKHITLCSFVWVAALVACGDVPASRGAVEEASAPIRMARLFGVDALDFQAAGNASYQILDYGDELRSNKNYLVEVLQGQQASLTEQVLVVAMAMQETNHMSPDERDASKDGTPSANISPLNLNIDMLKMAGYSGNDEGASMNAPQNLGEAVWLLLHTVQTWGLGPTLNFQRGGRTAFEDGVSYGAPDYRNAIATIYNVIAGDMSLLEDSRRVVVDLDHVF